MNFLFFSLKIICRDEILFASLYTQSEKISSQQMIL
jgi:hypothetical protein